MRHNQSQHRSRRHPIFFGHGTDSVRNAHSLTRLEHLIWSSVWLCAYFREIQARVALRWGRPRRFGEVRGGAAASGGGEVARTRAGSVIPANLMSAGIAPVASVRTVQVLPPLSTVASWSRSRSRSRFAHSGVIPASAQLSKSSFWRRRARNEQKTCPRIAASAEWKIGRVSKLALAARKRASTVRSSR